MQKTYYKGKFLSLKEEISYIKNRKVKVIKVVENDVVVILPLIGNKVVMERQYRASIGRCIYELPAGHIDKNESRLETVKRELSEETGYSPKKITFLFSAYPQPGSNTSRAYFYYADCFTSGNAHPESDEFISVKSVDFGKALKMIKDHRIIDTKTIAALLYYRTFSPDDFHAHAISDADRSL